MFSLTFGSTSLHICVPNLDKISKRLFTSFLTYNTMKKNVYTKMLHMKFATKLLTMFWVKSVAVQGRSQRFILKKMMEK